MVFICNYVILLQKDLLSHSEHEYIYDVEKEIVNSITSRGKISLQPYQSLAEAHYSLVR